MLPISFEKLWMQCEYLHATTLDKEASDQILDELTLKVKLYQTLGQKFEIPAVELQTIKIRTMGEILLTITKLSSKDDINVYEALEIARQSRS
jgi:hypothetical protein